jgi:Tol biopolymer transport system component
VAGTTERVSLGVGGAQGNADCVTPAISADGRYVAFASQSTNLVPTASNGAQQVFLRDRLMGTTELISADANGFQGNAGSAAPSISADGRFVAFSTSATNLIVGGDHNSSASDVLVRDRQNGTIELVSVASGGTQANSGSVSSTRSLSADGRYVQFWTNATNLVAGSPAGGQMFLRDRQLGTTEIVSLSTAGVHGNGQSAWIGGVSPDGRYVAFGSNASNLVPGDTNAALDVFIRDRQNGTTEIASVSSSGIEGNNNSGDYGISMSADARSVAFDSLANNLVPMDGNAAYDVFVHDRSTGTTEVISLSSAGVQGDSHSEASTISADGRFVAFNSMATNLVPGDTNGFKDVFIRDRNATGFTVMCEPGAAGVMACPCMNPPSGPGRGCDNSSATGGAILSASGVSYLSMDSLVFTTSGEKPTALSIFSQGSATTTPGFTFGQGVRCATTNLKRLYTKVAAGGSASAPSAGDPDVHTRSAALGDPITAGSARYYYVYYRDPTVLGGCPAASTFNTTQTGQVVWSL